MNGDGDTGPPGSSSALAPRAGSAGPLSPRYTSAGCTALSTRTWSTADTLSFLLAYREEHASRRVTQKSSDSHAAHRRRLPSRAFPCLGHFPQRTAARSLLTSSDLCGLQASSGIRPHTGDAQEPLAACPTPGFQAAQVPAALTLAPHQLPGAQRKQPARRGNARGLEMRAAGGCFLPPRPRVGKQHLGGRAGGGGHGCGFRKRPPRAPRHAHVNGTPWHRAINYSHRRYPLQRGSFPSASHADGVSPRGRKLPAVAAGGRH